ncbi:MAG: M24 family metallopeptidase, partial [Patescibacteria group bacterium]
AADPHCAGAGRLIARMPIVCYIFPLSLRTHYYSDETRTLFKGEPSDDIKKMYAAVYEVQAGAIGEIRAGARGREIYEWVKESFAERGFPTQVHAERIEGFIPGGGHGVGIDVHEPPRIGASDEVLEAGNVVTVEPGLYYARGRDHIPAGGIRIEDTMVVEKDGARILTRFPKDLALMIVR